MFALTPLHFSDQRAAKVVILLVEDYQPIAKILKIAFECENFDCDLAIDTTEALKKIKSKDYDLVLVSADLFPTSGYVLTSCIRAYERMNKKKPLVVIGMSVDLSPETHLRSKSCGMNECISKEFNSRHIVKSLTLCA